LVEDAAGLDHHDPLVGRALALAHARLLRLLGDGLVREHADPDAPVPLDEAGDGDAAGLDLAVRDPAALQGLQPVVAEGDLAAGPGLALHAAALLLAELDLLGHQHGLLTLQSLRRAQRVQLALEDPALHADLPEAGLGLVQAVVDVRAQGVERELSVQVPLGARDLGAVQAAGDPHLEALGPEAQGGVHRLAHGPAEGDALLELQGHRLRDQLRVQLGLQDLLDVDEDLLARALLDLLLQLVHLLALAPDDDPGAGGEDADLELVGGPLDVHARDAGVGEPLLQLLLQLDVLVQEVGVVLLRVPTAAPGLVEAQAEPDGMDLLTHALATPVPPRAP